MKIKIEECLLLFADNDIDERFFMGSILATEFDAEFVHFSEVCSKYPVEMKEKLKNFPFCTEFEKVHVSFFTNYQKTIMPREHNLLK